MLYSAQTAPSITLNRNIELIAANSINWCNVFQYEIDRCPQPLLDGVVLRVFVASRLLPRQGSEVILGNRKRKIPQQRDCRD